MRLNLLLHYHKKKCSNIYKRAFAVGASFLFSSCIPTKNTGYFKTIIKDTVLPGFIPNDFESKIQKKDVLEITVSSMSKEQDDKFNAAGIIVSSNQSVPAGYLVND